MERKFLAIFVFLLLLLSGCAKETSQATAPTQTHSAQIAYQGVKQKVVVGQFDNKSSYIQGVFSDNVDRMGSQAKTILLTHLQQSGRFQVMDRGNINELARESGYTKKQMHVIGAKYLITGDVTEFGRKVVGDHQLFGILGRGKTQVAYAKVMLNVVDATTSQIIYSAQGAGEYALSNREIVGFGGTAGYDSTLNGKVLDLAIREAVDSLAQAVDRGEIR